MKARSVYYNLFSKFFVYQEKLDVYLELINILKIIEANPLSKTSKEACISLLLKLDHMSNVKLIEEFNEIFYNPSTQNVRTTASYYDEGVESGKKRVEMQQFLAKTRIRRNEESFTEHEDSFPFIVTVLAELNELIIAGEKIYDNTQHCIFEQILNEFVDEFSKNVYEHDEADIFKDVIVILKSFISFERLYLDVSKPKSKEITIDNNESCDFITDDEMKRRANSKRLKAEDSSDESCSIDISYDVESDI
jgi:TorA maturation chaperone TorD